MPFMRTERRFLRRSSPVLVPWACQQKADQLEPQARNQSAWLHHDCRTGYSSRAAAQCRLLRRLPKKKFLRSKEKLWLQCFGLKKLDLTASSSAHTCVTCILRSCPRGRTGEKVTMVVPQKTGRVSSPIRYEQFVPKSGRIILLACV